MTIKYVPTLDDFTNLRIFLCQHIKRGSKQLYIQKYLGQIIFFILFLCLLILYFSTHELKFLIISLFALIACIFYPRFNFWLYKKDCSYKYNKIRKNSDNLLIEITITDDEIQIQDFRSKYSVKTSSILHIVDVKDYFFIQLNKDQFLAIPKKQIELILDQLTEKLKKLTLIHHILYIKNDNWSNYIYDKKSVLF